MAKPLGYYTNYNPQNPSGCLHKLQQKYGASLEDLSKNRKRIFRAALAQYIANLPVWIEGAIGNVTLMESCIESAGVDWNIWDEDPTLCIYIQKCEELDESDIEGLIIALTDWIREAK